jgi:hypothetical protein
VTVPKVVDPWAQLWLGGEKVTLFQVFRQSTSNTNDVSRGREKLRRNELSRFCVPGLLRFSALVRGALPIRYWGVLTVETLPGVANALGSMYCIGTQPGPMPRLQAVVPCGPVP